MIRSNILHLRASNFYGGPERQLHFHARMAKDSEFIITTSSFTENGCTPDFIGVISEDGLKTHVFDVKSAYDPKSVNLVRNYLLDNNFHILCTHDYRTHLIGYFAVRNTSIKHIAFSRGWTTDDLKVRLYNTLDKVFIRWVDHIAAVSDAQKMKLTKLLIPSKKISVVHNAINPDTFAQTDKIDLRSRFNFPGSSIVCISGGRFSREKGHIYLVRAAALALEKKGSLRFVLFGEGPELERVRKLIVRKGLENHILCPGFGSDLIGCLKGAGVLINPSLSEGLPNIVLEAMALKLPVIATTVGGVPELITDQKSGFLVPPGDETALAKAILRFIGESVDKDRMVTSAFEVIVERFSFDTQMRRLARIYNLVRAEGKVNP